MDVNWDNPRQNGTYGQAMEDLAAKLMRGAPLQTARRRSGVWWRAFRGVLRQGTGVFGPKCAAMQLPVMLPLTGNESRSQRR